VAPKIALTGATGYTGQAFLQAISELPDPWPVTALVRRIPEKRYRFVRYITGSLPGDLPDSFPPSGTNVIVHLGHENRSRDARRLRDVTEEGTAALLAAASPSVRGVILGSSLSVLGHGVQDKVDESTPARPGTLLARSRLATEQIVQKAMQEHDATALLLRPRFIMGPDDAEFLPGIRRLRALPLRVSPEETLLSVIDVGDYARIMAALVGRVLVRDVEGNPVRTPLHISYRRPASLQTLFRLLQPVPPESPRRLLPASLAVALCAAFPGSRFERIREQLELVTRSHWTAVGALEAEIGSAITSRAPEEVLRSYPAISP